MDKDRLVRLGTTRPTLKPAVPAIVGYLRKHLVVANKDVPGKRS